MKKTQIDKLKEAERLIRKAIKLIPDEFNFVLYERIPLIELPADLEDLIENIKEEYDL